MRLATIGTDGHGYQPIGGLGTLNFDIGMSWVGRQTEYFLEDDSARTAHEHDYRPPLLLPDGAGLVRWFAERDAQGNPQRVGLLRLTPTGAVTLLYARPWVGHPDRTQVSPELALSDDGQLIAGTADSYGRLFIVRSDGGLLPNGARQFELAVDGPIINLSLTFTKDYLYYILRKQPEQPNPGSSSLWRVPLATLAAPQKVAFAQSGNNDPWLIDADLAVSADGRTLALKAWVPGSVGSNVFAITDAGPAIDLTDAPRVYGSRGFNVGMIDNFNSQMELSPQGTSVAFTSSRRDGGAWRQLWIARSDGGSLREISAKIEPIGLRLHFGALRFIDDDTLVFAAMGPNGTEFFRYNVATSTLVNLSRYGDQQAPYVVDSRAPLVAYWWSADRRTLLFLHQHGHFALDLVALDPKRATAAVQLTHDAIVSKPVVRCAGRPRVIYGGNSTLGPPNEPNLFMLDERSLSAPQQLTRWPAQGNEDIRRIALDRQCENAFVIKGPPWSVATPGSLYRIALDGSQPPLRIPTTGWISANLQPTPDRRALIFADGPSPLNLQLKIASLAPGATPRSLPVPVGAIDVIAVY